MRHNINTPLIRRSCKPNSREQIYTYAVSNQGSFPSEIEKPRPKPGKHISTKVTTNVAEKLTVWAKRLGRTRAAHCCFLLECAVDDTELLKKVLR